MIVLGYRGVLDPETADARTLLTLAALHRDFSAAGRGVRVVAELLDQRHAPLATASGADDFVVSDEFTSLMLAQLSERRELLDVFRDLLDAGGSVIDLRPVGEYCAAPVSSFG